MQIIRTVCDIHYEKGELVDSITTTTIAIDKRVIVLDLCFDCKAEVDANLTLAFKVGRRPEGAAPTGVRRRTRAQIDADNAAAAGQAAAAAAANPEKVNKGHGGATYGDYKCDVEGCDREFNTAQGMSMHKIRGHRPKAVAEAA